MPRAKRNKVVALTKVKKDVNARKANLVEKVRSYVDTYKSVCVVDYQNMRTNPFKNLKETLPGYKFCLGKNKVMAIALGRSQEDSYKPDLWTLSKNLKGHCCLLFSNSKINDIVKALDQFEQQQYAQVGTIADRTLVLEKGFQSLKKFPSSMETHLRSLGLNIRLMNSQIELLQNSVICEQGKPISVKGSKLLRLLDIKLGRFRLFVRVHYDTQTQLVRTLE